MLIKSKIEQHSMSIKYNFFCENFHVDKNMKKDDLKIITRFHPHFKFAPIQVHGINVLQCFSFFLFSSLVESGWYFELWNVQVITFKISNSQVHVLTILIM